MQRKNNPKISPEIRTRIEMASKITELEVKKANVFRNKLIEEINVLRGISTVNLLHKCGFPNL